MGQAVAEIVVLQQATQDYRSEIKGQQSSDRPSANQVVATLLQAEKVSKQQRQSYPLEKLLGHWQLCFTTAGKVSLKQGQAVGKGGFYVPKFVVAQISFTAPMSSHPEVHPEQLAIGNQIQIGGILFRVTGQARYLAQKNLLAFDFDAMQLQVFGKTIFQQAFPHRNAPPLPFAQKPIAKLPFFSFFVVTEQFVAARGRGGGLAIWVKATNP